MESRTSQKEEIERGMQLAASKPDILPGQASKQISLLYEDIQRTLQVPLVNLIFRTLANYPDYLAYLWKELSPVFRLNAFEKEADALRGRALIEQVSDSSGVDWEKFLSIQCRWVRFLFLPFTISKSLFSPFLLWFKPLNQVRREKRSD